MKHKTSHNTIGSKFQAPGFTLIELLVVIAVIGMLASIVLVSLGPARAKARDAKRIAEVKQMSNAIEAEAASGAVAVALTGTGCAGTDLVPGDASSCTGPGTVSFINFKDPSTSGSTCRGTADTLVANQTTCQYSISKSDGKAGATTDNYEICFYLEQGTVSLNAGLNKISTGGVFTAICP